MKYFENIKEFLEKYPHIVADANREFIRVFVRVYDELPVIGINISYIRRLKIYQVEIVSRIFKTRGISYREFLKYSEYAARNGFSLVMLNTIMDIRERFIHSKYQAEEDHLIYLSLMRDFEELNTEILENCIKFAKSFFEEFIKKYSKEDKRW